MGVLTDQEIVQLVGSEDEFFTGLAPSLEDCSTHKIFTQAEALEFIGTKIKSVKKGYSRPKVRPM